MLEKCGIFTTKELHAGEFLGGRGRYSAAKIDKPTRSRIARSILRWYCRMPSLQIINAVMDLSEKERCFDWLLNRIDTNMKKASTEAIIISDHGKEYNAMLDRKRAMNDIPSQFGDWGDGVLNANIPITNIVERILYRDSASCPFIQAADLCAYALFRKEKPLASQVGLGVETLFRELDAVNVKAANRKDPDGIVRWYK